MSSATLSCGTLAGLVRSGLDAARAQRQERGHAGTLRVVRRLVANAVGAGRLPIIESLAPASDSGATILSHGGVATAERAAAANAAAITITQCDEGLREARGHPGLHAFPAASAICEERDLSLGDVLDATAVGWEVGARLGLWLGPLRDGVHPHGGWGTAAAAAASAYALGLDDDGVAAAVAIALTTAFTGPDSSTYGGQASHYVLPALGTANGVTAARLAAVGVEPPDSPLEHLRMVAHGHGSVAVDMRPSLIDLAYFKPVGVCAHALTAWEAARSLGEGLEPHQVASVDVYTYGSAAKLTHRTPTSDLARQFSIPWVAAGGFFGLDPTRLLPRAAVELAAATSVHHDPALDQDYPHARPVRLVMTTRQGRTHTAEARFHLGDREQPLSEMEQEQINARLVQGTSTRPGGRDLLDALSSPADTPWLRIVRQSPAKQDHDGHDYGKEGGA